MVAQWITILGGICMALLPPLAYTDQYISICRKRNATGFSTDIPGLLIVANVTRCIYWLGERFQIYLLIQSILMIFAQFGILYVCILYRDPSIRIKQSRRPGNLWQWETFPPYLEFTALLILLHCAMFLFLHRVEFYISLLGFIALGLEATLPIPQLLVNYENKSTAGFRHTVLLGWFVGDAFKTIYYFATSDNGIAFKACAVFQLSVDCLLLIQTFLYRKQTRIDLELRATQQSEEHDSLNGGGEEAGVAGPESLLHHHHHHHRGTGRPESSSLKSGSFRGGASKGESTETVFEVGDDELEDRDRDDDGDGEGSEWDVRSNRTKKSGQ